MIGFEYTYSNFLDVIKNITLIYNYSLNELIILILIILFFMSLNFYVLPFFRILVEHKKIEKDKLRRSEFLRKIKLQKDIEDKIASELNIR